MPLFRFSALAIAVSLVLSGCGSNKSDTSNPAPVTPISTPTPPVLTSLTGVVVDGYIQGAIVCVDSNNNLLCDLSETKTTTNAKGEYTLKDVLSSNSTNYAVIAIIPVGAIDQDSPTEPIAKTYTLSAPIGKHALISPLTSLVREYQQYSAMSTSEASTIVASLLGTNSADLFSDYAAAGASREQKRLQNLAKLAVKSFQDTLQALAPVQATYSAQKQQTIAVRGFLLNMPSRLSDVSADGYSSTFSDLPLFAESTNLDNLKLATLPRARIDALSLSLSNTTTFALQTVLEYSDCTGTPPTCNGAVPRYFGHASDIFSKTENGTYLANSSLSLYDLQTGQTNSVSSSAAYMTLTANGWVIPPSSNDTKASFSDNTISYTALTSTHEQTSSIIGGPIDNLSIRAFLELNSFSLLNQSLNFLNLLPIPATAVFPANSVSYIYTSTSNSDTYSLTDTNKDDDVFTAPVLLDAYHPEQTFTTLNQAQSYFTDNWFRLPPNANNLDVLLSNDGTLSVRKNVFNTGEAPITVNLPDKGTWEQKVVNGQTLTVLHLPAYLNSRNGTEVFWTVQNGQVVQGVFSPKGRSTQFLAFNQAAFNALKAAITLTTPAL